MSNTKSIKEQICIHLNEQLDRKIEVLINTIDSAKESRDNDTKSSAGDKYETGRAMMHIEVEKHEVQLSKTLKLKNDLSRISLKKEHRKVDYGSLIKTDKGIYFISIGIGKIEVDNTIVYAISLNSPLGKQLKGKEKEDEVQFQGREFRIKEIA